MYPDGVRGKCITPKQETVKTEAIYFMQLLGKYLDTGDVID